MVPTPFTICIVAIVLLGALGLPIGHAMIAASILYLLLTGLDLGTAAEQILNGLFNSYVLLAIPLFILAVTLPPGRDEITVAVRAAGINFADVFCRLGLYAAGPPFPFAPGFEVAGEVVAEKTARKSAIER